ncbi:hypothetical protein AADG42_13980 [Ammonicoccus fulvus]|uniref:XRE family transcriptional regulator n=1 Tax=Ammonicoccus fulvus TaxID=3138240 RepID=A0ABZ3FQM3_9ACTN
MPPRPTPLPSAATEDAWNWVQAAPFRVHVRRILDSTGLPWRAIAGYAGVPDNVVRSLLGRPERRRLQRLAPHYAARLLALDPARIRRDLALPGSLEWARLWVDTLMADGWSVRRVAAVCGMSPEAIRGLRDGRTQRLSRHPELLLATAARAHDLDPLTLVELARAA